MRSRDQHRASGGCFLNSPKIDRANSGPDGRFTLTSARYSIGDCQSTKKLSFPLSVRYHKSQRSRQALFSFKMSETSSTLFYAYARRSDHPSFSRYLMTFASAAIASEWWDLIQQNAKDLPGAERHGAQFFSFQGDNFVGRVWQHKAFEHLKTKWMYSQMGDANSTGGKGQDILPVQEKDGNYVQSGGGGEGGAASVPAGESGSSKKMEELLEKMSNAMEQNANAKGDAGDDASGSKKVEELLEKINSNLEQNATAKDRAGGDTSGSQKVEDLLEKINSTLEQSDERSRSAAGGDATGGANGSQKAEELLEKLAAAQSQMQRQMQAQQEQAKQAEERQKKIDSSIDQLAKQMQELAKSCAQLVGGQKDSGHKAEAPKDDALRKAIEQNTKAQKAQAEAQAAAAEEMKALVERLGQSSRGSEQGSQNGTQNGNQNGTQNGDQNGTQHGSLHHDCPICGKIRAPPRKLERRTIGYVYGRK